MTMSSFEGERVTVTLIPQVHYELDQHPPGGSARSGRSLPHHQWLAGSRQSIATLLRPSRYFPRLA